MSELGILSLTVLLVTCVLIVIAIVIMDVRNALDMMSWYLMANLREVKYKSHSVVMFDEDTTE